MADLWLDNLPPADTVMWNNLVAAFCTKWLKTVAVKASKVECIWVLKEWRLELNELGKKMEMIGGKEV